MSTRKHFIAVARTVANAVDDYSRRSLAQHHADLFAQENPRFDRGRFYAACRVNESDPLHAPLSDKPKNGNRRVLIVSKGGAA